MKKKKPSKKVVTKKQKPTTKKSKTTTKKVKRTRKKKRNIFKILLWILLSCSAIGIIGIFAFAFYIVSSCGEFDPNALANQDQTIIYDNNNNIIAKLGMEKRESVTYNDLPEVLVDAIIATEYSRYFEHNGVDGARFLKASIGQLLGNSDAGGASTLTMQVVKNNLTSREQSIVRKFKDVYLAMFFMEKKYTKEEIFSTLQELVKVVNINDIKTMDIVKDFMPDYQGKMADWKVGQSGVCVWVVYWER